MYILLSIVLKFVYSVLCAIRPLFVSCPSHPHLIPIYYPSPTRLLPPIRLLPLSTRLPPVSTRLPSASHPPTADSPSQIGRRPLNIDVNVRVDSMGHWVWRGDGVGAGAAGCGVWGSHVCSVVEARGVFVWRGEGREGRWGDGCGVFL